MKYRKNPVVIEAFQMTKERRVDSTNWPDWLRRAWNKKPDEDNSVAVENLYESDGTDRMIIRTPEGVMTVSWGDYIIQGVQGELYPCKSDIFEATYEPVEPEEDGCPRPKLTIS